MTPLRLQRLLDHYGTARSGTGGRRARRRRRWLLSHDAAHRNASRHEARFATWARRVDLERAAGASSTTAVAGSGCGDEPGYPILDPIPRAARRC